jgi:hypothetical protein
MNRIHFIGSGWGKISRIALVLGLTKKFRAFCPLVYPKK